MKNALRLKRDILERVNVDVNISEIEEKFKL